MHYLTIDYIYINDNDKQDHYIKTINSVLAYDKFDMNVKNELGDTVIMLGIIIILYKYDEDKKIDYEKTFELIDKFLKFPGAIYDKNNTIKYYMTYNMSKNDNKITNHIKKILGIEEYEEDKDDDLTFTSDTESILSDYNYNDTKHCVNDNLITLENYTIDDDPFMIYILNSSKVFEKAICNSIDEWKHYLISDLNNELPSNIMCLATTPNDNNVSGIGSHPSKNIIIKMPINQLYITLGSAIRINKEFYTNKIWYALPMYNDKRRRVSNLKGIIGSSMNHGQVPGFKIYKLFRRDEITLDIKVENNGDYPRFSDNLEEQDIKQIINILVN